MNAIFQVFGMTNRKNFMQICQLRGEGFNHHTIASVMIINAHKEFLVLANVEK